jgi:DNA-binding GntR family transcriptional regulator
MSVSAYPPLHHLDLSEQTYAVLRDRILRRDLKPGEKIAVEEVASGLRVSRTPVTDALKRLAAEGLVDIHPRRGTFVTEFTARDVAELFEIRQLVELHAVAEVFAKGAVAEFLAVCAEPLERMEQAIHGHDYIDYDRFISGDRDFHVALVNQTENRRLMEMYRSLNVHMQVTRAHYLSVVENGRQAQLEHAAIVAAFRLGDEAQVRRAVTLHIQNVKVRILELLNRHGGRI